MLKLPVNWDKFYVVNAAMIVLGVSCAMVGWWMPAYALVFPSWIMALPIVMVKLSGLQYSQQRWW